MAKWYVAAKKADFQGISEKYGISPVTARIIRNRDMVEEEEIRKFLEGGMEDLYSPALLKGMEETVGLLQKKIREKRPIRIIGTMMRMGSAPHSFCTKAFLGQELWRIPQSRIESRMVMD